MKKEFLCGLGLCTLAVLMVACGEESRTSAASFGAPDVSDIVDESVPAELKSSSSLLSSSKDVGIFACPTDGSFDGDCGATAAAYLGFLQAGVFQEATADNVSSAQYYRYWVDVVDDALSSTNERISGNGEAPACLSEDATTVDFTFAINGANVTVSPKLQCWENQGTTSAGGEQHFAFGQDDDNYYLLYRTYDNCTDNGCGVRFLLAEASADGNQADIWMIGYSYQSSVQSVNAQRVLANKETGEFTFNAVHDPITSYGGGFQGFYGRTDGTNAYFEATVDTGSGFQDLSDNSLIPGSGGCYLVADMSSGGDCSGLDRSSMPSTFGLSVPMSYETGDNAPTVTQWLADSSAKTAFLDDLDTIGALDLSAAGVTEWTTDSAE